MTFRQNSIDATEMVFGIIGPIGCNRQSVIDTFEKLAKHFSYKTELIKLSDIIRQHCNVPAYEDNQYLRVNSLMTAGSALRGRTKSNSIIAKLAAAEIHTRREKCRTKRVIYVIDSIKHPDEVEELRNIYGVGFYLFALHSSEQSREHYLKDFCMISEKAKRDQLIERDKDEKLGHGQSTREAFHLADFFLTENGSNNKLWNVTKRFFEIIFGDPYKTPTFNEYAMYLAYAAAIKSADMSRQVGAVIAINNDIISTGANECPSPMGGTYWPHFDPETNVISDIAGGRDYMIGVDRNALEKSAIINTLKRDLSKRALKVLTNNIDESGLNDITEYGRVVHAEMDAILTCARRGTSTMGAVLFCSTYPCHNCAKHIIASGITQVVYIEPYPKSKALEMHRDAIRIPGERTESSKVLFSPFVGVGPRLFANLFSLTLSTGERISRKKSKSYTTVKWDKKKARPRMKMLDASYTGNEDVVKNEALASISKIKRIVIDAKSIFELPINR